MQYLQKTQYKRGNKNRKKSMLIQSIVVKYKITF